MKSLITTFFFPFPGELELFLDYSCLDRVEGPLSVMELMEISQRNQNKCFSIAVVILQWNISPQLKY